MDKKLLTIGEVAKRLGVSIDTLRRWDKKGTLRSIRATENGYRYYSSDDVNFFVDDLFFQAKNWVENASGIAPKPDFYCQTNDVFQNRLIRMQNELAKIENLETPFSLIAAATGEIGNNSFDHNLGNWPDTPGIFFAYNLEKRHIILADRGQGILKTLQRVRPRLNTHVEALNIAFTEVISGRAPEARGNGLKYVKEIVLNHALDLLFQTGDAKLSLTPQRSEKKLNIDGNTPLIHGCFAILHF